MVAPLDLDVVRPHWSVMIPVFNCSRFLAQTLASVLDQDPGPALMQIEVVDDASTDADVSALVAAVGRGRVSYFRQSANVGSLRNFHACLERSRGHHVHILHGDDRVRKGFYTKMEALFREHPSIGAGFCRYAYVNEEGHTLFNHEEEMAHDGVLDDWLPRLCERQRIQYAAMVVRRPVYEAVGGFYGVEYGEDWEMWVRIAARYPMGYTPDVLAEYRRHYASISGRTFATGENMKALRWVMRQAQRHLPPSRRQPVMEKSRNFYAHYALRIANTLWTNFRDKRGASAQARAAWNMSRDAELLFKIIKLYTRITLDI
jgi:glycosyltransferase involved in cell wall biosynthesis